MNPAYLFHNLGGMDGSRSWPLPAGAALGPGGRGMAGMGVEAGRRGRVGPAVPVRHQLPERSRTSCSSTAGELRFEERSYAVRAGPGRACRRLGFGTVLPRRRPGRPPRPGGGQRARAAGRRPGAVRRAVRRRRRSCSSGDGAGSSATPAGRPGRTSPRRGSAAAWPGPTSTTTAGRTWRCPPSASPVALLPEPDRRRRTAGRAGTGRGRQAEQPQRGSGRSSRSSPAGRAELTSWSAAGSYLSASDRGIVIGLGQAEKIERLSVRWPSGVVQELLNLPTGNRWRVQEGAVAPEPIAPSGQ